MLVKSPAAMVRLFCGVMSHGRRARLMAVIAAAVAVGFAPEAATQGVGSQSGDVRVFYDPIDCDGP